MAIPIKQRTKRKRQVGFQKRIEVAQEEEMKIYKKAKIARTLLVYFPNKVKVPFLAKVASYILAKCGGILDVQYRDIKK